MSQEKVISLLEAININEIIQSGMNAEKVEEHLEHQDITNDAQRD